MEIIRQSGDAHTNGDVDSEEKTPEESPQHVTSDSVSCSHSDLVFLFIKLLERQLISRTSNEFGIKCLLTCPGYLMFSTRFTI